MSLDNPDFYLMSQSPRRKMLLKQVGADFHTLSGAIDETPIPEETPYDYVSRIARTKARLGSEKLLQNNMCIRPVLAADTIVVSEEHILGKPKDKNDALTMLAKLSHSTHKVMTAVVILSNGTIHERISTTLVEFSTIEPLAAESYWETGEPCDKAGAYGIQGLGATFVKNITGSYSGVVGLPLWETIQLFKELDIPYWSEKQHSYITSR